MRILLAIDDSKFSEAAIAAVIEHARPQDTEVRVLHVVESLPLLVARELGGYEPALENALEFQNQHAEALVTKAVELLRARGLKVAAAVEDGDPKSKKPRRRRSVACRLDRTWLTRTEEPQPFSDGQHIGCGSPACPLLGGNR